VLARWQDFAGAADLLRTLSRRTGRQRKHRTPARAQALNMAARAAIESLITSVGDRAAEDCLARWREHPAGAALLSKLSSDDAAANSDACQAAAEAGLIFGWDAEPGTGLAPGKGDIDPRERAAALGRSSPDLPTRAARAVSGWQDHVTRLVQAENVTKRSIARAVSLDEDSLATVLIVSLMGASEDETSGATVPRRVLASLFGAGPLRDIMARSRADLRHRITLILDEEMRRFAEVLAAVGTPDAAASLNLYQATYALEVAR
jgi:hypothetical protein